MLFSKVTLVVAIAAAAGVDAQQNNPFGSSPRSDRYTKISVMGVEPIHEEPSYTADYPASVMPEETSVDYEYTPDSDTEEPYSPKNTSTSMEYIPETTSTSMEYAQETTSAEYVPETKSVESSSTEEHKTDYAVETTSTEHKVEHSPTAPYHMPTGYAQPTEHKPEHPIYPTSEHKPDSTTAAPYKPTGYVQPLPVYEIITNIKTASCTLEHGCPKPTSYVHPHLTYNATKTMTDIKTVSCTFEHGCPKPTGYDHPHSVYNTTDTMTTIYAASCDHPA